MQDRLPEEPAKGAVGPFKTELCAALPAPPPERGPAPPAARNPRGRLPNKAADPAPIAQRLGSHSQRAFVADRDFNLPKQRDSGLSQAWYGS